MWKLIHKKQHKLHPVSQSKYMGYFFKTYFEKSCAKEYLQICNSYTWGNKNFDVVVLQAQFAACFDKAIVLYAPRITAVRPGHWKLTYTNISFSSKFSYV